MTKNYNELTSEQILACDPAELVELIAQMLYDKAIIADLEADHAVLESIKTRYTTKSQTYCEAAENVRALIRD